MDLSTTNQRIAGSYVVSVSASPSSAEYDASFASTNGSIAVHAWFEGVDVKRRVEARAKTTNAAVQFCLVRGTSYFRSNVS